MKKDVSKDNTRQEKEEEKGEEEEKVIGEIAGLWEEGVEEKEVGEYQRRDNRRVDNERM